MVPHGVHSTVQTAFRLPGDLLGRLKGAADEDGRTMTAVVTDALTEWLDRRSGITTAPVSPPGRKAAVPPARFEPPCPHPKARINKGLCGACGTHVGTEGR